jgi:hypothetical protein
MKLLLENWRKHLLSEEITLDDPFWKQDEDARRLLSKGGRPLIDILRKAEPKDLQALYDYLYTPYGTGIGEGTLHYLPGADGGEEKEKMASIANEIENFIGEKMKERYDNPSYWSDEEMSAFDQINNLLNVLFPSGD